ncbi:MAG TPA: hypothetical protein VJU84_11380 [Pyrinomonadaceae bacterium]|nr:hypothetical protein [Pyrinomonadaceae bacterium]
MISAEVSHSISTDFAFEGNWPTTLALPSPDVSLEIGIPKFCLEISAPLMELFPLFSVGEVVLKAAVETDVSAVLTLTGKPNQSGTRFQTERFSLVIEASPRRPRALFISSTIMAMLGISGRVHLNIPAVGLASVVDFPINLPIICARLEERQLAYRAMVIEAATHQDFIIPKNCTGSDLGEIGFAYHAIVDKSFVWPNRETFTGSVPANQKAGSEFARPTSLTFKSVPITRSVFDEPVQLGPADVVIEDAVILDNAVLDEISVDDGHHVEVQLRSRTGRARYNFLKPPSLSKEPWGAFLKTLVDAEDKMDNEIIEHYNKLASTSVLGLSDAEGVETAAPLELSDEGFDWEIEDSYQ